MQQPKVTNKIKGRRSRRDRATDFSYAKNLLINVKNIMFPGI